LQQWGGDRLFAAFSLFWVCRFREEIVPPEAARKAFAETEKPRGSLRARGRRGEVGRGHGASTPLASASKHSP
jgi:hypothetical protein